MRKKDPSKLFLLISLFLVATQKTLNSQNLTACHQKSFLAYGWPFSLFRIPLFLSCSLNYLDKTCLRYSLISFLVTSMITPLTLGYLQEAQFIFQQQLCGFQLPVCFPREILLMYCPVISFFLFPVFPVNIWVLLYIRYQLCGLRLTPLTSDR